MKPWRNNITEYIERTFLPASGCNNYEIMSLCDPYANVLLCLIYAQYISKHLYRYPTQSKFVSFGQQGQYQTTQFWRELIWN